MFSRRVRSFLAKHATRSTLPARVVLARAPAVVSRCATPIASRTFVASSFQRGQGTVDSELSAKLSSEIQIESEMKEYEDMPEAVQTFLQSSSFTVEDLPGTDEVTLSRTFGNEEIKIVFSVADMNNAEEAAEEFEDESTETDAKPAAEATEDGAGEDGEAASFPVRCNITITKDSSPAALCIDTVTQDGIFIIDSMVLYKDAKLAKTDSAEADWKRREAYMGPPFSNLDEDLQILMEKFLEERDINTALALFIPDYVDYKEAREYEAWLHGLKDFVDA
ncbi:mitochondrial glyco protein [Protomyces lactucae-debilis]|uniref:Mitochondrial glyco protein n=1 Tax=Protomyces lactucae-debilis TaxID=2754530 RepID=A0A1Y2F6B9_PROLT|nr:mitochondrial glyco protein [Protomyces lactucae-debilis]ORY79432.1 mitochondrial glyco protein [Protomyces lactucae-debilis]